MFHPYCCVSFSSSTLWQVSTKVALNNLQKYRAAMQHATALSDIHRRKEYQEKIRNICGHGRSEQDLLEGLAIDGKIRIRAQAMPCRIRQQTCNT